MAEIEIVTFRGRATAEDIRSAQLTAREMIIDIIADGLPESYWWAEVFWYENKVMRTWRCPSIGKWTYSPWLPLYQKSLFN